MKVCIPSKGRAGACASLKILPSAYVFVPASEGAAYRRFYQNVIDVPIEIRGITATRNFILNHFPGEYIVMIDDDVKAAGFIDMGSRKGVQIKIGDESVWEGEFKKWFAMCDAMGYKIWGLKTESARRSTYPYRPFLTKTYVTASCMGIVNDGKYRFDEDFKVKEDYEICLRHIKNEGGILGVRYMHWENEHWEKAGGCKAYRTVEMERDAIKRLIKMYPGMVKSVTMKNSIFTIKLTV